MCYASAPVFPSGHALGHTWRSGALDRQMTDYTFGIVTPFTVTSHTLPMEGALQSGLSQGTWFRGFPAVAFAAGWKLAAWAVVMADAATFTHTYHFGMQFMIELYWRVKI